MTQVLPKPAAPYPRISTIRQFVSDGCKFHVMNSAESFRVDKFGGEEQFTKLMLDELRPGDVFFDIGACIGFVAVHAAKLGANVFAFEPEPSFRERLRANFKLNDLLDRATLIDWAVSDMPGKLKLYTDGAGGNSPSFQQQGDRSFVEVPVNSLDCAVASRELSLPDVIKLDVEGAETLALKGMQKLLASSDAPRSIFVELHPAFLPSFNSTVEESTRLIESYGYDVHYEESRFDQILRLYRKA